MWAKPWCTHGQPTYLLGGLGSFLAPSPLTYWATFLKQNNMAHCKSSLPGLLSHELFQLLLLESFQLHFGPDDSDAVPGPWRATAKRLAPCPHNKQQKTDLPEMTNEGGRRRIFCFSGSPKFILCIATGSNTAKKALPTLKALEIVGSSCALGRACTYIANHLFGRTTDAGLHSTACRREVLNEPPPAMA